MTECRGDVCTVLKYRFKWDDIDITGAEGKYESGSPPTDSVEKIDAAKATAQMTNIKKAIDKKAKDQAEKENKKGRSLTKKITVSRDGPIIMVDATCGPEGKCLCDDLGEDVQELPSIRKTFTVSDLTEGADAFSTPGKVCKGYSVTFEVPVTPVTSKGRCLSLKPETF